VVARTCKVLVLPFNFFLYNGVFQHHIRYTTLTKKQQVNMYSFIRLLKIIKYIGMFKLLWRLKTPVKILLTKLRAYDMNALPAHIVSQTPNPY
jgi:hypothetical protein